MKSGCRDSIKPHLSIKLYLEKIRDRDREGLKKAVKGLSDSVLFCLKSAWTSFLSFIRKHPKAPLYIIEKQRDDLLPLKYLRAATGCLFKTWPPISPRIFLLEVNPEESYQWKLVEISSKLFRSTVKGIINNNIHEKKRYWKHNNKILLLDDPDSVYARTKGDFLFILGLSFEDPNISGYRFSTDEKLLYRALEKFIVCRETKDWSSSTRFLFKIVLKQFLIVLLLLFIIISGPYLIYLTPHILPDKQELVKLIIGTITHTIFLSKIVLTIMILLMGYKLYCLPRKLYDIMVSKVSNKLEVIYHFPRYVLEQIFESDHHDITNNLDNIRRSVTLLISIISMILVIIAS